MTRLLLIALIAAAVCMVSGGVGAVETAWIVDDDVGMDRTAIRAASSPRMPGNFRGCLTIQNPGSHMLNVKNG
ncbi:MAG: hypothetical protein U9O53_02975 [archaeon]|nr:hypothetical protein [archaeon]